MSRRCLLLSACLLPLPVYAQTQLCDKLPNCAELGFSTGYEDGCAEDGYLICPFNSNYRKCVKHNCAKMGFTQDDKANWCDNIVKCESDESYTLCSKADFCKDYPLDSCPTTAERCSKCSIAEKYKIDTCKNGYLFNNSDCVVNTCPGYTLPFCPAGATSCAQCLSGTRTLYKVNSCKAGYVTSGATCIANRCSGYDLSSCPSHGTCSTCLSGTTNKYRLDSCDSGYIIQNGTCYDALSECQTECDNNYAFACEWGDSYACTALENCYANCRKEYTFNLSVPRSFLLARK